jgi:L-alanine-DL-glutamate epimerase-like enolase superfamily enzyme
MRVLEAEAKVVELALAEPFSISTTTWESATNVFVSVRYDDLVGIGEASPDDRAGESPERVVEDLNGLDLSGLEGPFDLDGVAELLPAGSARCALDIAFHDLAAKVAGISVSELLGLRTSGLPVTSVTIPIAVIDDMVERARGLADHPVLKTKVGFDGDVEVIAAIRDVYDGRLTVDANEGWSSEEAIDRLRALERYKIELCEQPIARGDFDALRKVTQSTSIPVYADEDARTAEEVGRLSGVVDGVNLKLRKCGGIREAVRAAAVARGVGLGVMLGCDLESGVAATAQARVSALVDHADLDGPLLLARDPWPGVSYDRGVMTLPPGPGLGVRNSTG